MNNFEQYLKTNSIIGNWQSKRLFLDKLNGYKASYSGNMSVLQSRNKSTTNKEGSKKDFVALYLKEEGFLKLKDETFQFSQRYQVHLFDSFCDVLFSDGIMFFRIRRVAKTQAIDHLCHPDRYFGQISFVNESSFLLSFNVTGPKKDYYLKILYKR